MSHSLLRRFVSLGALGAGAFLLLADSRNPDCDDGYHALRFAARFTSNCPASLAPPSGTLRIDIPANDDGDGAHQAFDDAATTAVRAAGFSASGRILTDQFATVCTALDLTITTDGVSCSALNLHRAEAQTIRCEGKSLTPPVLQIPPSDSGADDSGDASNDASNAAPVTPTTDTCTIVFERLSP